MAMAANAAVPASATFDLDRRIMLFGPCEEEVKGGSVAAVAPHAAALPPGRCYGVSPGSMCLRFRPSKGVGRNGKSGVTPFSLIPTPSPTKFAM